MSPAANLAVTRAAVARALDRLPPAALPALVGLAAATALFLRHRDVFLIPQFYAEDGALWYARANNIGAWRALFIPDCGYFQIFATITAALATTVPLARAPLVFAAVAAAAEVLPAVFLASRRAARVIPDTSVRLLLVALYVTLPNTWTNCAVVTYAHWRLALVAFLVMLVPAQSACETVFDVVIVVLAGLGGPLVMLLAPIALLDYVRNREQRLKLFAGLVVATAAVQAACLLFSGQTRSPAPLGPSVASFFAIVANQIVLGVVLGQFEFTRLAAAWPGLTSTPVEVAVGLAGLALLAYAAWRGPYALRLFVLYAAVVLAAALSSASVAADSQWDALTNPGAGTRYFLFGMLAFVAALVWLAGTGRPAARTAAAALLAATLAFGIVHDWKHPRLVNLDFPRYAAEFEAAPPGTRVEIPINPPGWTIRLVKR